MKNPQKSANTVTTIDKTSKGFTDEERARELKAEARRGPLAQEADGGSDAGEDSRDAATGSRHGRADPCPPKPAHQLFHREPGAGYPYAKDANVVCFFQSAHRFIARYATFGFSDKANLDEGTIWAVTFALKVLTADDEAKIGALVKKTVSCGGA